MNPKCYKSAILAPTFLMLLTEWLKKLQQAAFAPFAAIFELSTSLSGQGFLGEFPRLLEQIAAPLMIGL